MSLKPRTALLLLPLLALSVGLVVGCLYGTDPVSQNTLCIDERGFGIFTSHDSWDYRFPVAWNGAANTVINIDHDQWDFRITGQVTVPASSGQKGQAAVVLQDKLNNRTLSYNHTVDFWPGFKCKETQPSPGPGVIPPLPSPTVTPTGTPGPGRIARAQPGAVAESAGLRVTLNELRDPFQPRSQFAQPDPGQRFVAFDVTIQRTGGDPSEFIYCGDFYFVDTAGFSWDDYDSFAVSSENLSPLRGTSIAVGESIRGWCAIEVPQAATLSYLGFNVGDPFSRSDDIQFRFGP